MSEIGKIEQLTTDISTHRLLTMAAGWRIAPPTISLAEHDRTLKRVLDELHAHQVERAHVVNVLTTFRDATRTIASISKVLDLLDDLLDGPTCALCGPKETPTL